MRALRPAVVLVLLALDRATKIWAARVLSAGGPIRVLPFFELSYAENRGAAFSLGGAYGGGANAFFVVVSAALIVFLVRMMRRWPKTDVWLQAGGTLVLAGALGNLYDRIAYRYVVDFLYLHHWPVFNVADSCITVGACLLAWGLREEPKAA
jgi:signal peptidase II